MIAVAASIVVLSLQTCYETDLTPFQTVDLEYHLRSFEGFHAKRPFDSRLKIDLSAVLVCSITNTSDSFGLVSLISANCYLILCKS